MNNTNQLEQVHRFAGGLLARLDPSSRRKLSFKVAHLLRQLNNRRITNQQNPSGQAYTPRNINTFPKKMRRAMFAKIKQRKYLKTKATANIAEVYFAGNVAKVARIHHYGLKEHIPTIKKSIHYPRRELLGITSQDLIAIDQVVINHLANLKV